jgi:Cu/Ag efflux pump CusA
MMTAFAYILGVIPLAVAIGASAGVRTCIGIAVFAGILFASTASLFFIPTLYFLVQGTPCWASGNRQAVKGRAVVHPAPAGGHD